MRTVGTVATRVRARLLAVALFGSLIVAPLASLTGAVTAAHSAVAENMAATALFANYGMVTPGIDSEVTLNLTNSGTQDFAPSTVTLSAVNRDLTTTSGLADWLATNESARGTEWLSGSLDTVKAGSTGHVSLTIPGGSIPWTNVWGPEAVLVSFQDDNGLVVRCHAAVLVTGAPAPRSVALSLIAPVTVSDDDSATISSDSLESAAAPGGALARISQADSAGLLTLAIDPRIPASLASQSGGTPAATAWWKNLDITNRPHFSLAFGDADLAGQTQAGAPGLLNPGVTDPSAAVAEALSLSHSIPSTTSPSSPSGSDVSVDVNRTTPAWPAAGTVNTAALQAMTAAGYGRVILSSSNTTLGSAGVATAQVGSISSLITDDILSQALTSASAAASDDAFDLAMSSAVLRLAAVTTDPGGQHASVATLSRYVTADAVSRLTDIVSVLSQTSWVTLQSLDVTARIPPISTDLVEKTEDGSRLESIAQLLDASNSVNAYSVIGAQPEFITQPVTRQIMTTLAVGTMGRETWPAAIDRSLSVAHRTLNAVHISTGSVINMIGSTATIPLSVENDLATPVTVFVAAQPRNARLTISQGTDVKIEARAQAVAKLPAEAHVSNGSVLVDVTLATESGVAIGTPGVVSVSIHADWETIGLVVLGVVFVGLLSAGVYRTLRRRKAEAN